MENRVKLMTEVAKRMRENTLSPLEGYHCLKAIASHMTAAEVDNDIAWTEGYLEAINDIDRIAEGLV